MSETPTRGWLKILIAFAAIALLCIPILKPISSSRLQRQISECGVRLGKIQTGLAESDVDRIMERTADSTSFDSSKKILVKSWTEGDVRSDVSFTSDETVESASLVVPIHSTWLDHVKWYLGL